VSDNHLSPVTENPWRKLRAFTDARIGQGRAGNSLPTSELLAFQLDHARAQDAVHQALDVPALIKLLTGVGAFEPQVLQSQAANRLEYLQRPDYGRRLHERSQQKLREWTGNTSSAKDLAIVIADGLSARAVQNNALPMLQALLSVLATDTAGWQLAPVTIVEQGRVAIGDEIGECLNANAVLVMIGERPGLSSPDSLGLYLTWAPRPGRQDAERNCISNVRPAGLSFQDAAHRLMYLLQESRRQKLTGVHLKDRTKSDVIAIQDGAKNFLTQK